MTWLAAIGFVLLGIAAMTLASIMVMAICAALNWLYNYAKQYSERFRMIIQKHQGMILFIFLMFIGLVIFVSIVILVHDELFRTL